MSQFRALCSTTVFAAFFLSGHALSPAATIDVDISNFAFSPANVTISIGDTVRWTNRDPFEHTATSGTGTPDGHWDSGSLGIGASFSHVFQQAGIFPYYCIPHGVFMSGNVTVQGGANMAPTVLITSPTNNSSFTAPATVIIQATATDADGTVAWVEFFDGTITLGLDTTSPYSITSNLALGSHTLTAVASDNQGATNTSATVTVNVGTAPITNPIAERVPKGDITIELQTVVDGLASPLGMAVPNDNSGRIFVYDQDGRAWVVVNGAKLANPLLDLRSRLVVLGAYDERGLLGMAAHPQFAQKPLLYTYTSETNSGTADFPSTLPSGATNNHQSVIAEWRIDPANTNQIDPTSRREIMRIDKPQSNHNGGAMHFGPDGLLYISLGDGGAADDQGDGHAPGGNGQDTNSILGKVLRIDVNTTNSANGQYAVPSDNPFVGLPGVDEIYAYGFRNPFSFSFDRLNGELFLGDVGQNHIEEIDRVIKGGNYGWNIKEGTFFFDPNGSEEGYVTDTPVQPVPPNLIDPIAQYDHDDGLAIVGGYIYRGNAIPGLQGRYITGDWGTFTTPSGRLYYLDTNNTVKEFRIGLNDRPLNFWLKGFGEDAAGEIYVFVSRALGPSGNTGRMLKIVAAPEPITIGSTAQTGTNVTLGWTGGNGPFAVQKKNSLTDPTWMNRIFTAQLTTNVPADGPAGFFRVVDTAHQPAIPLTAWLTGFAERPNPLTNSATGSGTFSLEDNTLRFEIRYSGLSGNATAAHIHGAASAAAFTGVQIDLAPFNGGAYGSNGTVSGLVLLTAAQKAMILAGQTYVNFHTSANPGGEMRGQIAPVLMQTSLSGLNERPNPLTNNGNGSGTFSLVGNQLTFNITYRNLSGPATAAHIHGPASESQFTGVMVDLSPYNGGGFGSSGSMAGTITLTAQQLAYVIDGLTYVNVHTSLNPSGEMRGQIHPQSTAVPLTAAISGLAERPTPLTNSASGSGTFSLEGNRLTFNIRYEGLSSSATAAHIHGPATAAVSTGVQINFAPYNGGSYGSTGAVSGSVVLTDAQKTMVLNGQTYVNFHTSANPGGEMRGQIAPVLMASSISGGNERPNAIVTSGNGSGIFTLVGTNLSFNLSYRGLSETASAAHIHGPASAFAFAGVLVDLSPFTDGGFKAAGNMAGTAALTFTQLAHVIDGLTYVNFHTPTNPNGEMRGQMMR